jgi:hypothetical protein
MALTESLVKKFYDSTLCIHMLCKEYMSFKVNHNTLSGANLAMALVFDFEKKNL